MSELPRGWAQGKFGGLMANEPNSLTDGPFGSKLKTAHYVPSGARVVRLGNIGVGKFVADDEAYISEQHFADLAKHHVFPGDLLIAALADPVGRCCAAPPDLGKAVVKADCFRAKPHAEICNDYIIHYLNSPQGRAALEAASHGLGRLRINLRDLRAISVPVAPAVEQLRIVAKLDRLFERTGRARENLSHVPLLIGHYKQAILDAAFRGELTVDWRERNDDTISSEEYLEERRNSADTLRSGRGIARDVKTSMIYRDQDLASAITPREAQKPLPSGWSWAGTGEVFGVYVGATPSRKKPEYWGGSIPWVSSGEVAFCRIIATAEQVSEEGLANASTRLHPVGTVLLGMIGEGKTRGQAAILDIDACNNQNCAAIRVSEAGFPPEYVYWYLFSEYERTRRVGAGNNQPALNKDRVQRLLLPLPSVDEARIIVKKIEAALQWIDSVSDHVDRAQKQSMHLDEAILDRAFRGELVLQDPDDEPASVLLDRVQAEYALQPKRKRRGKNAVF